MERPAADRVATVARDMGLPASRVDQLHTAVAETVLNAMEHGNQYQRECSVLVRVLASPEALAVRIADQGDGGATSERETPDLAVKLAGQQSVRGWGFYLIEHMVDQVRTLKTGGLHTVELFLYLEGRGSQYKRGTGGVGCGKPSLAAYLQRRTATYPGPALCLGSGSGKRLVTLHVLPSLVGGTSTCCPAAPLRTVAYLAQECSRSSTARLPPRSAPASCVGPYGPGALPA